MNVVQHNNFTLIRLVLATLVLFGHFKILPGGLGDGLSDYADVAVDGFFIVSGYLVSGSIDKQPSAVGFYMRRLFRLYPLYAVTIFAQALLMLTLVPNDIASYAVETLRYIAANLIFANFLAHDIGGVLSNLHNGGINPSLWTLKIEVGFYVILPVLWLLARRFEGWFLLVVFAVSTLLTDYALSHGMENLARQLPCQLRFFVVGIALYRYRNLVLLSRVKALALGALMVILCELRHYPVFAELYPIALGLLLFVCAFKLPIIPMKLDISYGVYLFHAPLIQLSVLMGWYQDSLPFLLLLMLVVFVLAFIAEKLIERPGIALGRYVLERWQIGKQP